MPAGTQSKPPLSLDQGPIQANPNDVPISKEICSESEHGKASQIAYQLLASYTFFCTYLHLRKYIKAKVTLKCLHEMFQFPESVSRRANHAVCKVHMDS